MVSVAEDANDNYRSYMEDGHNISDPLADIGGHHWSFFAVYDGHGGRQATEYVEKCFHGVIAEELRACGNRVSDNIHGAIRSAFEKVDATLAQQGAWKVGCTATIALVEHCATTGAPLTLHVAHVGDSRALLLGDAGSGPERLTADHRAVDETEAAQVRKAGSFVRKGRVAGSLCVSRSLGDHNLKPGVSAVPDVCERGLDGGGRVLVMATDGLWDALDEEEVRELVEEAVARAGKPAAGDVQLLGATLRREAARELVERAKARGSRDNITALVVFL